jgi:hypothetical protein
VTATTIPDDDLLAAADTVTIWVANLEAPTDMWSLAEAIRWVMARPDRLRITLFRPPGGGVRAAWLEFAQIERLAFALGVNAVFDAA